MTGFEPGFSISSSIFSNLVNVDYTISASQLGQ